MKQIYDQLKADLGAGGVYPSTRKVVAAAIAGAGSMLSAQVDRRARENHPLFARGQSLDDWCLTRRITRKPALPARIYVNVECTEERLIPAGTKWKHPSGDSYSLEEPTKVRPAGTQVTLTCDRSGFRGNITKGDTLTITSTIPSINSKVVVLRLTREGIDEEDDDALRERLRLRMLQPLHGGAPHDYIHWATEHPIVARAWVLPRPQGRRGVVHVAILKADSKPPSQQETDDVKGLIEKHCPSTADVEVVAPSQKPVQLYLELTPNSQEVIENVRAELRYLISAKAAPQGFKSFSDTTGMVTETGEIAESDLHQAISSAPGHLRHRITAPVGNLRPQKEGQILIFGDVHVRRGA